VADLGLMPKVVCGHHGHLPEKGERQEGEDENRDEAPAHHAVRPGRGEPRCELAPAAGVQRHRREEWQRHDHEEATTKRIVTALPAKTQAGPTRW